MNLSILELPKVWPTSEVLNKNFDLLMSKVSKNTWRSALIESLDQGDIADSPKIYHEDNEVEIIKIIGSKAVFDVTCREQSCWFVYNAAALDGWKAYAGPQPVSIYKANLGLIGVKLPKGKHLLWLEYDSLPLTIGLNITLLAWVLGLILLLNWYFNAIKLSEKGAHVT